jgi:flagellin
VGSEAGDTIDLKVKGFSANSLGGAAGGDLVGTSTATALQTALAVIDGTTEKMSINGQEVGILSGTTVAAQLDTINQNVSGVETSAFVEIAATADGDGILRGTNTLTLTLALQDGTSNDFTISDTGSLQEVVDQINAEGGTSIQASINDEGRLLLASDTAASITIAQNSSAVSADALGITAGGTNAQLSFEITDPSVTSVDIEYSGTVTPAEIAAIGVQARDGGDITGSAVVTGSALSYEAGDISINGVEIDAFDVASGTTNAMALEIAAAFNEQSDETGVVASTDGSGALILNSVSGDEIQLDFGGVAATATAIGLVETNNAESQGNTVDDINISTQAGATAAIEVVDLALEQINSQRADLGAINNRLDFTVSNLSNVSENTSAARSRIMDADFASETAELSRAQVLQQASQAILAQANARPQQVLSLLN